MGFDKNKIKPSYSTAENDVPNEFYNPVLRESVSFDIAVGYFTTQGLLKILEGIEGLLNNNGKMRLLIGDPLTSEEYKALKNPDLFKKALKKLNDKWNELFNQPHSEITQYRLEIFSWLYNKGHLEIKYGFRKKGMYHKKIGILKDQSGEIIAFSGSINLTDSALKSNKKIPEGNSEEFSVFPSWEKKEFKRHGESKIDYFNQVWEGKETNTKTVEMPSKYYELIKSIYPDKKKEPKKPKGMKQGDIFDLIDKELSKDLEQPAIQIPDSKTPRKYQKKIINNWFKNKGTGIIQMATGTGKTITAISAAVKFVQDGGLEMLVVICPQKHLANQWVEELGEFNFNPISAYISSTKWKKKLNDALLNPQPDGCLCVVTTSATFLTDNFQRLIDFFPNKTMIVGDEAHNYGSSEMAKKLPLNITYRMGLSATPERHGDEEGTDSVFEYFGKTIKPIVSLKDALDWGVLTKYYYHPIQTELNDEEYDKYEEITKKISKLVARGYSIEDQKSGPLKNLMIQRARIVASCANKIPELIKIVKKINNPKKFLVYCGDGKVDSTATNEEVRQVDEVTKVLGNDLGLVVSQYTFTTLTDERKRLQLDIASGKNDGIVAIRCLDEGIDIPEIETAFILASSTNPKQFIQRRGRILRIAHNKDKASIYDFIVTPPIGAEVIEMDRNLLSKEMKRCIEFAELAKNHYEARKSLNNIVTKYNLLHL